MKKLHEKSPCCGENIWRLNEKRRQCSKCKKTWRVWKKQRGRKTKRQSFEMLFKYLKNENGSMAFQAKKKGLDPSTIHRRMAKIIEKFNRETPWPEIPDGELIAVADAMIEFIDKIPHVVYFVLLRSVSKTDAIVTSFAIVKGIGEGSYGWELAFNQIPQDVKIRIKALVCDGVHALARIAFYEGWILQKCQFHLRAKIIRYCSPRKSGKQPKFAKELLKLTNIILTTKKEESLNRAIIRLTILKQKISAKSFRTIISGFIKNYEDYRTYLKYPELNLPNTSNSIECFIGQIRNLQRKAKGFRSEKSLKNWIETYCKFKKKVTCNPKIYIPN